MWTVGLEDKHSDYDALSCVSDRILFYFWNSMLIIDTLSQYFVMFFIKDVFKFGFVTKWMALILGTLLSLVYFVTLLCKKQNGNLEMIVVKLNGIYLATASLSVLADILIRFINPLSYCTVQLDTTYECNYDQLYLFTFIFIFYAIVWRWINGRMQIFAASVQENQGDYTKP